MVSPGAAPRASHPQSLPTPNPTPNGTPTPTPASGWTATRVRSAFKCWCSAHPDRAQVFDLEALEYVEYHAERYARLLSTVDDLLAGGHGDRAGRILDVGPGVQTLLLRDAHPDDVVDTLGFAHPAADPRDGEQHIRFDLNDAYFPDRVPRLHPGYDVIVLAEVVEHLYTSLATVLRGASSWLAPGGHLVIQTPNGAALHKRLRLLFGRSPVEPPRAVRENPGHFHEYTVAELCTELAAAELELESLRVDNHYGGTDLASRLYGRLGTVLPLTFRHGVTVCARAGR